MLGTGLADLELIGVFIEDSMGCCSSSAIKSAEDFLLLQSLFSSPSAANFNKVYNISKSSYLV